MRQSKDLFWKVLAGVASAVALVLAAWIALTGVRYQTDRPIAATQTAEMRVTQGQGMAQTQAALAQALQAADARVTGAQSTAQASIALAGTQMAEDWAKRVQQTVQAQSAAPAQPPTATATINPLSLALPLEQLPASIFAFSGSSDSAKYAAGASFIVIQHSPNDLDYKFDFYLPQHAGGWAGMAFTFETPQDFSAHQTLELALTYGAQNLNGDMVLRDANGKEFRLPIGPAVPQTGGVTVQANGLQQTISAPMSYFGSLDLKFIKEMTFLFDSSRFQGASSLTVNSWRLLGE